MKRLTALIVLCTSLGVSLQISAQEPETPVAEQKATGEVVVWTVQATEPRLADEFRQGVRTALADEVGRHLLDEAEFERYVKERAGPLPSCFRGLEACVTPKSIIFDALNLSLVVRVTIEPTGKRATWTAIDARGQALDEGVAEGSTRQLGFKVVADLFDATGAVSIETTPEGAEVVLDGTVVGTTPHLARLPVGRHEYVLRLDGYQPTTGLFEAKTTGTQIVRHDLKTLQGVLIVSDAPSDASVFINGVYKGRAGEPIDLPPGSYAIETRAEGYETMQDAVMVEAGTRVTRSAPLKEKNAFLRDFGSEAIALNNYVLRIGYEHVFQTTTFQDARSSDDIPFEFTSFADDQGLQPTSPLGKTIHGNGVRADFSYNFTNFGIVLLSASYHAGSPDQPVFVRTPAGVDEAAQLTDIQRLQLRPFQVSYRHFYNNFVPFAELGTGIDFQWLSVNGPTFGTQSLSQSDAFVGIGFGAQYFFIPEFFALARYSVQGYFDSALGADHLLYVGVGLALPNLFGFDAEPPESL